MKIAVTFENGNVFQHFGHTEKFKIYDVSDNKVVNESIVDTNGSGHGALAGFLKENSVDTLICGGIGNGAKQALATVQNRHWQRQELSSMVELLAMLIVQ